MKGAGRGLAALVTLAWMASGLSVVAADVESTPWFREVSSSCGVDFRHHHGGSGARYNVETIAGGVVVFDFDGDGDVLFIDGGELPGYQGEPARSRLFRNDGVEFVDFTDGAGLDIQGYGEGASVGDLDNAEPFPGGITSAQRNQVLINNGAGRFDERTDVGLDVIRRSRGLAVSDLDLDGDLDVVINNVDDRAEVYENVGDEGSGPWLQIDLEGSQSNRQGIDSRLDLTVGNQRLAREVRTASSFLSQNSATVHYGLGEATTVGPLEIRWSIGKRQRYHRLIANKRVRLYE